MHGSATDYLHEVEAVVHALKQQHERWSAVVNERDVEAYADLVAADVVWIPPSGDAIVGRAAFHEWLRPFFESFDYEYVTSNTRFLTAGNWAAENSDLESRMTPIEGGPAMSHAGSYTVIWKLDSDGTWRIDRYVDQTHLRKP